MRVYLLWSETSEETHERPKVEFPCLPRTPEARVRTRSKLLMKHLKIKSTTSAIISPLTQDMWDDTWKHESCRVLWTRVRTSGKLALPLTEWRGNNLPRRQTLDFPQQKCPETVQIAFLKLSLADWAAVCSRFKLFQGNISTWFISYYHHLALFWIFNSSVETTVHR